MKISILSTTRWLRGRPVRLVAVATMLLLSGCVAPYGYDGYPRYRARGYGYYGYPHVGYYSGYYSGSPWHGGLGHGGNRGFYGGGHHGGWRH